MTNERKEVSEAPVNFGANLGLMLDLYDDFLQDPSSVPEDLQVLFSTIKNDDSIVPALKVQVVKIVTAQLSVSCV